MAYQKPWESNRILLREGAVITLVVNFDDPEFNCQVKIRVYCLRRARSQTTNLRPFTVNNFICTKFAPTKNFKRF